MGIKPYRQCATGYVNGVYVSIPKVEELILSIRSRFRFRNKGFRISMLEVMVGWWKTKLSITEVASFIIPANK